MSEVGHIFSTDKYKMYKNLAFIMAGVAVFLLMLGVTPLVSVFILVGIISMYPMRFIQWLGVELCFFLTVLTSMVFGPISGILVGKVANTIGVTIAGQLDQNIIFDFGAFFVLALVAAMFPAQYITIVGIVLLLIYHAAYMIYNKTLGTYDTDNMLYSITNLVFNIAIFWRLGPLMVGVLA